jgi:N-acetylglucosamine kinase-like BadF-type ATPase
MLLGVDGGGTKTDVVLADLRGLPVASVQVGCTNHESVGMARAMAELRRGVDEAFAIADAGGADIDAAVFGLAGVDWPSDEVSIGAAIDEFELAGIRLVVNDSHIALRAGATGGWGIVSSIGTGAVCAGANEAGAWFRTMAIGWGEPCGSYSLVRDALHAIAAAHHRTGPPTLLTDGFLTALELPSVPALFERISRGALAVDAAWGPLVSAAADAGDRMADRILRTSGSAHAAMVVGVAEHLRIGDEPFELVTSGGVHVAGGRFGESFREHIVEHLPRAMIVGLHRPPVDGAVLLALDQLAR